MSSGEGKKFSVPSLEDTKVLLSRETFMFQQLSIQTWKKIKEKKVYYCLGFCACFIVVLVVALLVTIIGNTPVVFMRLGELTQGEVDLDVKPGSWVDGTRLNFTQIETSLSSVSSDYSYVAPRYQQSILVSAEKQCNFNSTNLPSTWPFIGYGNDDACTYQVRNCFTTICAAQQFKGNIILTDSEREKRMGLGRNWDLPKIEKGHALLQRGLASTLGVSKGDTIYLQIEMRDFFGPLWIQTVGYEETDVNASTVYMYNAYVPVIVQDTFSSANGKFSTDVTSPLLMEYNDFVEHVGNYLSPFFMSNQTQNFTDIDLYQYAQRVALNLPPPRIDSYLSSNFDTIQANVVRFASQVVYKMGFQVLQVDMPVLTAVRGTRFFSLFLGLILNIIIIILLFLSILLIYSLLMINVETRTFEIGVLRMLGSKMRGVVELLLLQAFSYAIPSWAIGLVVAQLLAILIMRAFETATGIPIDPSLTPDGVGLATFLGLIIPIIASIFPIRSALGQNLQSSLDVRRSKTKAVKISIHRTEDHSISWSVIIVGVALTGFGFGIYFVFPLALLSFNFALLLNLFFMLLLGMLLGLVILSLNVQHMLERLVLNFFFFWERRAIPSVVLKNLVAHRERNRKTTIMYALSLGFIIFINVSYSLTLDSFTFSIQQQNGVYLKVAAPIGSTINGDNQIKLIDELENVAKTNSLIENYAWVSAPLSESKKDFKSSKISNIGKAFEADIDVFGVSPSLYTAALRDFLKIENRVSSPEDFTLSEALYTIEGSKSLILGSAFKKQLGLSMGTHLLLNLETQKPNASQSGYEVYRKKPLAFLNLSPAFFFSQFPSQGDDGTGLKQATLVSFPTYAKMATFDSVEQIPMKRFLIKMKSGITDSEIDSIISDLRSILIKQPELTIWDYRDAVQPITQANDIMTLFFNFTTIIAMLISFFSLMSSMYTNIYEQSKEIGILRAIGVHKWWMYRIYIYEAFVLVFSASLLGIMIGTVVGYTMTIQRILFTQLPVPFAFPYLILVVVFIASVVFSVLASWSPIRAVVSQRVVTILRMLT